MLMNVLAFCLTAMPCLCLGQESSKMDVSLNVIGLFPSHVEGNGVAEKASASSGVLASFRYSPFRFATFEFNYAHSRDTQHFTNAGVESSVRTGIHELTGAYVLNLPLHSSRVQPFLLVGAGIIRFAPASSDALTLGAQSQTRPIVLWGAGINYDFSRHFSLRFEYRGLFYEGPDFNLASVKADKWQPMA